LASSTVKRVVVYRFNRQSAEGYVNPSAYLLPDGLTLLTTGGSLEVVPYSELKALGFAAESAVADLFSAFTAFERRPRVPGLWIRLVFLDGDEIEGILPPNLLDSPRQGYLLTPPRASAARQRVFVPREALRAVDILGATGVKRPVRERGQAADRQLQMFD
jgi:hypothetical protein